MGFSHERVRVAGALVVAVLLILAVVPAGAEATFPGRPGRIAWAYAANDPGYHLSPDYGIQTVAPSGRGGGTVASCETVDETIACPVYSGVAYSADGNHLVWAVTTVAGVHELVVANASGTHPSAIIHPGENDAAPS